MGRVNDITDHANSLCFHTATKASTKGTVSIYRNYYTNVYNYILKKNSCVYV